MDKLIHDDKGNVTISNDGATIMKLLDIVHPAAKILVDIAKSQDSEVSFAYFMLRKQDHKLLGGFEFTSNLFGFFAVQTIEIRNGDPDLHLCINNMSQFRVDISFNRCEFHELRFRKTI